MIGATSAGPKDPVLVAPTHSAVPTWTAAALLISSHPIRGRPRPLQGVRRQAQAIVKRGVAS